MASRTLPPQVSLVSPGSRPFWGVQPWIEISPPVVPAWLASGAGAEPPPPPHALASRAIEVRDAAATARVRARMVLLKKLRSAEARRRRARDSARTKDKF